MPLALLADTLVGSITLPEIYTYFPERLQGAYQIELEEAQSCRFRKCRLRFEGLVKDRPRACAQHQNRFVEDRDIPVTVISIIEREVRLCSFVYL